MTLYSSSLPSNFLDEWKTLGYNVNVEKINLKERAVGTPLKPWADRLEDWHAGPYYYAHLSDALRLVVLYNEGGVYFDTDVVFVNNMDNVHNGLCSVPATRNNIDDLICSRWMGTLRLALQCPDGIRC